jgi:hypothetical protein
VLGRLVLHEMSNSVSSILHGLHPLPGVKDVVNMRGFSGYVPLLLRRSTDHYHRQRRYITVTCQRGRPLTDERFRSPIHHLAQSPPFLQREALVSTLDHKRVQVDACTRIELQEQLLEVFVCAVFVAYRIVDDGFEDWLLACCAAVLAFGSCGCGRRPSPLIPSHWLRIVSKVQNCNSCCHEPFPAI